MTTQLGTKTKTKQTPIKPLLRKLLQAIPEKNSGQRDKWTESISSNLHFLCSIILNSSFSCGSETPKHWVKILPRLLFLVTMLPALFLFHVISVLIPYHPRQHYENIDFIIYN